MPSNVAPRAPGVSLHLALLGLVALAFLAGIVPAGVVLDRWLARELATRARQDLAMAPGLLSARDAALHDAMMMHAKDLAHAPALEAALRAGDRARAAGWTESAARALNYAPVLVGPGGAVWEGPPASASLVGATRRGEMPVAVVSDSAGLHLVGLAPVGGAGAWLGAVGVASPLDEAAAGALAGLTRSDLVVLVGPEGRWVAGPPGAPAARAIASAAAGNTGSAVRELRLGDGRYLVAAVPLGGATAVFARDLRRELAIVPRLRWVVLASGLVALGLALLLGSVLARRVARPVRVLAAAADRLSAGDFEAPLVASTVREVDRVTTAFDDMRRALAVRIEELRSANRMLEERRARLAALQSELIQRERVATSARMAAELAHEIRNPVANVRNCLELLHRRLRGDPEGEEFAALAIDELLRMHELAERILDLNRPSAAGVGWCDAATVARDVVALARLGTEDLVATVDVEGRAPAAIAPDALKQVLLNLVQNARDAVPRGLALEVRVRTEGAVVRISVSDNGPGIPAELRERVFDPFFTTRGASGVGLGLFLVDGVVRAHGGTVAALDGDGRGARLEITLPAAPAAEDAAEPAMGPAALAPRA